MDNADTPLQSSKIDITQQIEPVRRSILDVLCDNLKAAKRKIFVHRLIYIGEHAFKHTPGVSIGDFMEKTIKRVNSEYNVECLTGVLLCYPKHFCHLLEGPEDSIIKHLMLLVGNKMASKYLGRMKVLICYHHINQRFLPGWIAITGKPQTLLERIDEKSDLESTFRHVYHCVQKLYKLAYIQKTKTNNILNSAPVDEQSAVSSFNMLAVNSPAENIPKHTSTSVSFTQEKYPECLPEYGLLEFLLITPHTQNLHSYIKMYGIIPKLDAYKDKVWPVPTEFVPFNIFDKPYDPAIDLPMLTQQEPAEPPHETTE